MDVTVPEASVLRHFKGMQAAFEQAMQQFPDSFSESFYTFGGRTVHMRIVGRELAGPITQPFSHLRADGSLPGMPHLTIDLWDENETGIRRQPSASNRGDGWTELTALSSEGRFIAHQLPNTISYLDLKAGHIAGSIAWSDRVYIYERAKPLARLLLEWHNHRNVQVIHGGLVSRDGQGILFAGKSGSGKSTAALACLYAGFGFLSEDYVGLQHCQDGSFLGHSLYNSLFLETGHLERFQALAPHVIKGRLPRENKSVIVLSQVFPERLVRVVPIRALALCQVADGPGSRVRPASKGEALLGLGVGSLLQIPSPGTRGLDRLAGLVERVPCYWLELGRDLEFIPLRVEEILAEVSQL